MSRVSMGRKKNLMTLGGNLIRKLLHPGSHIDDHDYRDDGRSVGCQSDRQEAEHGHRLLCRHQCGVVGVDHHEAQGHAQHRVHAEPLGRGVGQHQRQEVEGRIACNAEQFIGRAGRVHQARHGQQH